MWEMMSIDLVRHAECVGAIGLSQSDRFKVPGGWIVKTIYHVFGKGGGGAVSQIFVTDPGHEWDFENEGKG